MAPDVSVAWFRRDLRTHDLPMLAEAARADRCVPLFVFDRTLLAGRFRSAGRTAWMRDALGELDAALRDRGGRLVLRHGDVVEEVVRLARNVGAARVHVSDDVTPYGRARDLRAERELGAHGIELVRHPGLWTVEDVGAVRTQQGKPYTVFGPFLRRWRQASRRDPLPVPREVRLPAGVRVGRTPSMAALGFDEVPELEDRPEPGQDAGRRRAERWLGGGLGDYAATRDRLDAETSRMGVYLRFGCVSSRWLEQRCEDVGGEKARAYVDELAWRDFYAAVLLHFPHVARQEFVEKYRRLEWVATEEQVEAWKAGRTGFPVVDAAMHQLVRTGFMHNRARMIVGSFLTKDLGADWRVGEEHFMHHLLDGDQVANNGGWQWIASTGTDPAPYFQRMFNPTTQQQKFDPDGEYVRRWRGEDERPGGKNAPEPIVDHAQARRDAVERYRAAARDA